MLRFYARLSTIGCLAIFCVSAEAIDFQTIGKPGNAPYEYGNQYGAVAYSYQISTKEVSNSDYVEFLNAVAQTDTHGLYIAEMSSRSDGGITRNGSAGSYTYATKSGMANRAVRYVNFWDACRFVNWMNNGKPTGSQTTNTTETGTYALNGITKPAISTIARSPTATYALPTTDEWYKAAYFDLTTETYDTTIASGFKSDYNLVEWSETHSGGLCDQWGEEAWPGYDPSPWHSNPDYDHFTYDTQSFRIVITPVPEPATIAILAMGPIALLRRRKKTANQK